MISSFAWTSLLLGFFSLYLMQALWRHRWARWGPGPRSSSSWRSAPSACTSAVSAGSTAGISWSTPDGVADVVVRGLDNPFSQPRLVAVLLVLTAFLVVGYSTVCAFAGLRTPVEHRSPRSRG
jgi:hypothetical protein